MPNAEQYFYYKQWMIAVAIQFIERARKLKATLLPAVDYE